MAVGWVALGLSVYFWNSAAHNAAFDYALGRATGLGFISIWGVAILWQWFAAKHGGRK
jgi:hypothetical protein